MTGHSTFSEDGQTIRDIEKMSVYEASFVNLPMNPLAEVQQVKSLKKMMAGPKEELMVTPRWSKPSSAQTFD